MQYFTLIGGFTGFILAFLVSLVASKNLEDTVFNATIGCVLTALLFRVFRFVVEYCAKQVVAEKARLRDIEKATAEEAPPPQDSMPETPAQPAA
jgi:phosphotransferase system  glucose/maltose/N-acetylglucosamine-specific IIC component